MGNIGRIPELEIEITVLRGRNISIIGGLQSYSQLSNVYGRNAEDIFRDNFVTKIFLAGLDRESNEKCSQSLGEFTHQEEVSSFSYSDNRKTETRTMQRNARRLLTGDEVRRLQRDKFILIHGNRKPAILEKNFYNEAPKAAGVPEPLGEPLTIDFESAAGNLRLQREAEQMAGRKQIGGAPTRKQLAAPKQKQIAVITYRALPPMPEMPAELIIDAEVIEDEEEG
jgi:type IV secretory pathway TraG/TraD family ATPase VirD4